MNHTAIRIPLEEQMSREIFETIDGKIIEDIIKTGQVEKSHQDWKHVLEGHSFKISDKLAPNVSLIIDEVLAKLGFEEPVDFFISNSPEMNAYSISAIEEGHRHIVTFNAGLFDRLDDEELRFVIGHELGHIFTRNARIMNLIRFVFPADERIPMILARKINLWQKLAELTADRYGYIACSSLEKCVSAFFKISSGLNSARISFDFNAYLEENERLLNQMSNEQIGDEFSHPVNPVRIKHLDVFSRSQLCEQLLVSADNTPDAKLEEETDHLTELLMVVSGSELDFHRRYYMAAAGLYMAGADGKLEDSEYESLLQQLSIFTIFPEAFLNGIVEKKNTADILQKSAATILSVNPVERYPMLHVLSHICFANGRLEEKEIELIYSIGEGILGFSKAEIAQEMASAIRERFLPKVYR